LERLLQSRGIDAAELAARMQEAGMPITEEDIEALMVAERGEEFLRVAEDLEDAIPYEN
jgi:hypothetical protein